MGISHAWPSPLSQSCWLTRRRTHYAGTRTLEKRACAHVAPTGTSTSRITRLRHVPGRPLAMIKGYPLTTRVHACEGSPRTHVHMHGTPRFLTGRITFRFREGSPVPAVLSADSPIRCSLAHTHAHTYMRTHSDTYMPTCSHICPDASSAALRNVRERIDMA